MEGHTQTKSEGVEKDVSGKWKPKRAGVAILVSDNIDFKTKTNKKERRGQSNKNI